MTGWVNGFGVGEEKEEREGGNTRWEMIRGMIEQFGEEPEQEERAADPNVENSWSGSGRPAVITTCSVVRLFAKSQKITAPRA
jgi:hypothetical protein